MDETEGTDAEDRAISICEAGKIIFILYNPIWQLETMLAVALVAPWLTWERLGLLGSICFKQTKRKERTQQTERLAVVKLQRQTLSYIVLLSNFKPCKKVLW